MSIDRKPLLRGWLKARRVLADPRVPPRIKALAKQAADHAQVALELDSAVQRKAQRGSAGEA